MSEWRREAAPFIAATGASSALPWREWDDPSLDLLTAAPSVAISFVGYAPTSEERRRALERVRQLLAPNGMVIVADHNRPRRTIAAWGALLGPPWVPGASPRARWQRPAYPTAREVQGAGFRVLRLVLLARERVQLLVARRETP